MLGKAPTMVLGQHMFCHSPALLRGWGPWAWSERQCGRPEGGQGLQWAGELGVVTGLGRCNPVLGTCSPLHPTVLSLLGVALPHDCPFSNLDAAAALQVSSPVLGAGPSLRRRWRTA